MTSMPWCDPLRSCLDVPLMSDPLAIRSTHAQRTGPDGTTPDVCLAPMPNAPSSFLNPTGPSYLLARQIRDERPGGGSEEGGSFWVQTRPPAHQA
jgi:hypothetical protein